jgi:glycosyltransferase involved in cell wall biosynthesis
MPAYNAEKYIGLAIESIQNQTLKDYELIVVNDASTDTTLEIAKSYAKNDKRIKIISNSKNLQIAGSLNKGAKAAVGKYIARMDADDYSYPKRLELQCKLLNKQKSVVIVGADMRVVDKEGEPLYARTYPPKSDGLKKIMFRYSPFAHPVVMYRKETFDEFGGYDRNRVPCEDIDLWFKFGSKYKFASIPKVLLDYRLLPETSNSHKKLKEIELLGFEIKLEAIRRYGYKPNLYDLVYNIGQLVTMWVMPVNTRIWLYNQLRSKKII